MLSLLAFVACSGGAIITFFNGFYGLCVIDVLLAILNFAFFIDWYLKN